MSFKCTVFQSIHSFSSLNFPLPIFPLFPPSHPSLHSQHVSLSTIIVFIHLIYICPSFTHLTTPLQCQASFKRQVSFFSIALRNFLFPSYVPLYPATKGDFVHLPWSTFSKGLIFYFVLFCFCFYFVLCWGATHSSAQDFILHLCSGIIPGKIRETRRIAVYHHS